MLLDLIKRLDTILGTNKNFELGIWTRGALEKAKLAVDDEHSLEFMEKVFLFASKNQVSLWGPNGEINDYSAREWNGLMGEYYYGRWDLYFNMMFDMLDRNETINMDKYHDKAVEFGREWDRKPDLYRIDHYNPTFMITKHHNTLFKNTEEKFISFCCYSSFTHSLIHYLTISLNHSITHSFIHYLNHSITHSLTNTPLITSLYNTQITSLTPLPHRRKDHQ